MKPPVVLRNVLLVGFAFCTVTPDFFAATNTLVGWNDFGIHYMDGKDYSVFSLQPPYNSIRAQAVYQGRLLTNITGITVTYEAIGDPGNSTNRTSQGKGNFWQYVGALFGTNLAPDMGLAGFAMPGTNNQPKAMTYDAPSRSFKAEGIPITPYDDAQRKNYYPMMRLVLRSNTTVLATTDMVLPVSDETGCQICHASGGSAAAKPAAGWVWDCDAGRDYRLNILRMHDQSFLGQAVFSNALATAGYSPSGLYATVVSNSTPILCLRCHQSGSLPVAAGIAGIKPLTQAMHSRHANAVDPITGQALNSINNQSACYHCHPGPETRPVRGAMAHAAAADGTQAIQCQSCHGSVSQMGATNRVGWLDEPDCQSCHTGTATSNNGQIRYLSAFEPSGQVRQATNQTFAVNSNTPTAGYSLFRYSKGHGGLFCSACHGSPHAEYVSSGTNDNVQSFKLQNHVGIVAECIACHTNAPSTVTGGPHGLHPIGQTWISGHRTPGGDNPAQCQPCHGVDYRGTILSQAQSNRVFSALGTRRFPRGAMIGCYDCHNGAFDFSTATNRPPTATNAVASTGVDVPVSVTLTASDPNSDPVTYRIAAPPAHGLAGISNNVVKYVPEHGYVGTDSFGFFASDRVADSTNGATVSISVTQGVCVLTSTLIVPTTGQPNQSLPFRASASLSRCVATPTYQWSFGDGSALSSEQNPCHVYTTSGTYSWTLIATANGISQTNNGVITISTGAVTPVYLTIVRGPDTVVISWPSSALGSVLQETPTLNPPQWNPVPNSAGQTTVTIQNPTGTRFYRLKQQ